MSNRKRLGICRALDKLGRLVIPKEVRDTYHITSKTPLIMHLNTDGEIVVTPVYTEDKCSSCGSGQELRTIGKRCLCKSCIQAIKTQIQAERNGDFD